MSDLILGVNLSNMMEQNIVAALSSPMRFESRGLSAKIDFSEKKYDLLQGLVVQGNLENFLEVLQELKAYWRLRHTDVIWIGVANSYHDFCLADYLGVRLFFSKEWNLSDCLQLNQRWLLNSKQKHHVTKLEQQFVTNLNQRSPTDPFSDDALIKLCALNPWYSRHKIIYALRLIEKLQWEQARLLLEELVKSFPHYVDAQVLLAQCYLKLNKEDLASSILIKIDNECSDIFDLQSQFLKKYASYREQSPLSELALQVEHTIDKIKSEIFYEVFSESILKKSQNNSNSQEIKVRSKLDSPLITKMAKSQSMIVYQSSPLLSILSLNQLLSGQFSETTKVEIRHAFSNMTHYGTKTDDPKLAQKEILLVCDDLESMHAYVSSIEMEAKIDILSSEDVSDSLRLGRYRMLFLYFRDSLENYEYFLEDLLLMDDAKLIPTCVLFGTDSDEKHLRQSLEGQFFFEGFYSLPKNKDEFLNIQSSCKESFLYQGGFKSQLEACRMLCNAVKFKFIPSKILKKKLSSILSSSISEEVKINILADSIRIYPDLEVEASWIDLLEESLRVSGKKNIFMKKIASVLLRQKKDVQFSSQKYLLELLSSQGKQSYEKMYTIAKIFLEDTNPSGLHKLLEYWLHNDKIPKNLCFELVFTQYFFQQNFPQALEWKVIESSLERYPISFDLNLRLYVQYKNSKHQKIADFVLEILSQDADFYRRRILLIHTLKLFTTRSDIESKILTELEHNFEKQLEKLL